MKRFFRVACIILALAVFASCSSTPQQGFTITNTKTALTISDTQIILTSPAATAKTTPPTFYSGLRFIGAKDGIYAGEVVQLTVHGKPNTTYSIYSFYVSYDPNRKPFPSISMASDADGYVSWSWQLDKNAPKRPAAIQITDGDEVMTHYFEVL